MHAAASRIGAPEERVGESLGRRSTRDEFGGKQNAMIEMPSRDLDVMHHRKHGASLGLPTAQDMQQFFGGKEIEARKRLVEEKNVRSLSE